MSTLQIVSSISLIKNWTNIKDSEDIWMKRLVNIKQAWDCAVKGRWRPLQSFDRIHNVYKLGLYCIITLCILTVLFNKAIWLLALIFYLNQILSPHFYGVFKSLKSIVHLDPISRFLITKIIVSDSPKILTLWKTLKINLKTETLLKLDRQLGYYSQQQQNSYLK